MKRIQAPGIAAIGLVSALLSALVEAQPAQTPVDLGSTLKDGAYSASAGYGVYSDSLTFQKRGRHVVGYRANMAGVWCFQGNLRGDLIDVSGSASRRDEWVDGKRTGKALFEPVSEGQQDKVQQIQVAPPIHPFPRKGGLIPPSPQIIKRDQGWLDDCARHFGSSPAPPPEQETCPSRYYVTFIARGGMPGHAFVQWVKVDAEKKMTQAEAFGFYPQERSHEVIMGRVPGALRNEYLQGDGIAGDVVLRLRVSEKEYQETQKVRDAWSRRAAAGTLQYDLWEMNCIDFTSRMVRALSDMGSSIQIPPHDSARGPLTYLEALYELNEAKHVSATDFGVACP